MLKPAIKCRFFYIRGNKHNYPTPKNKSYTIFNCY